jgi:hypothetical protein
MDLILDILIEIASYDEDVWYKMTIANDEFALYSRGIAGIKMFRLLFTKDSGSDAYINGTYIFGLLNSIEDEPGVITSSGSFWYKNGKYHRDNDLPAMVFKSGTQEWYKNGEHHRDNDMPASIYFNGTQIWSKNGKHHRDNDMPAMIINNGTQIWCRNGKYHRDNGPAIIYYDGIEGWYQNGKFILKKELT